MFVRTLATVAAITAVLAAPSSCGHKAAPAAQACNPPAAARLIAYTDPATDTLYVNACAVNTADGAAFDLVHIPIRVEYRIRATDPSQDPRMTSGIAELNLMHVSATTTYTHPIHYPIELGFVLTATFTYVGRNAKDIGTVLECWHEIGRGTVNYERTALQRVVITHNNYRIVSGVGAPSVTCEFDNPPA